MLLLPTLQRQATLAQLGFEPRGRSQTESVSLRITLYYLPSKAFSSFCLRVHLFLTESLVKQLNPSLQEEIAELHFHSAGQHHTL